MVKPVKDSPQCAFLLVNGKGEVLLQLRSNNPKTLCPNMWGTFGGALEEGEMPEAALVREVREELGYDATGAEHFGTFFWGGYDTYAFSKIDPAVRAEDLDVCEGERAEFFSKKRVAAISSWAFNCREIIEAYFERH